ncbi:hypothetical protein C7M52_02460 [Mixta theicola]|nr:hypothetical protein C7M52_02460 [Mixta theicola]
MPVNAHRRRLFSRTGWQCLLMQTAAVNLSPEIIALMASFSLIDKTLPGIRFSKIAHRQAGRLKINSLP